MNVSSAGIINFRHTLLLSPSIIFQFKLIPPCHTEISSLRVFANRRAVQFWNIFLKIIILKVINQTTINYKQSNEKISLA